MPPVQAAFKVPKEIYFAVISTTITLAAVFLPIVFMGGISGQLFKEFAIVVSGSVLVSAFVALTLTPMSAYFLKRKRNGLVSSGNRTFLYSPEQRICAFINFLCVSVDGVGVPCGHQHCLSILSVKLPSELAPVEDRSNMNLIAVAPEGVSFDYMKNTCMMEVGKYVNDSTDGLYQTYSMVAISFIPAPAPVNVAVQSIYLKDPKERKASIQDLYNQYGRIRKF